MGAKIAERKPEHQNRRNSCQLITCTWLGNSVYVWTERGGGKCFNLLKGGVVWIAPVGLQLPYFHVFITPEIDPNHIVRCSGRWRISIHIGRQITKLGRIITKIDHLGIRISHQHFIPLEHCYTGSNESTAAKHVKSGIISVRPYRKFRIIRELIKLKGIPVPCTQRITGFRNGYQFIVFSIWSIDGKLACHPAICHLIIK